MPDHKSGWLQQPCPQGGPRSRKMEGRSYLIDLKDTDIAEDRSYMKKLSHKEKVGGHCVGGEWIRPLIDKLHRFYLLV